MCSNGLSRRPAPAGLASVAALLCLAGCATDQSLSLERAQQDPWEASNRKVYEFNKKLDKWVVRPVTQVYRTAVPKAGRTALNNMYNNYGEPRNILNYLLQGKVKMAFQSLDRLLLNTTLGVGGTTEVGADVGLPRRPTDFGQTFSQWGIKAGPYVMLPFFGPSTLRDGIGTPFDFVIDPADFARNALLSPSWYWRGGQITGRVLTVRAQLIDSGAEGLLASSLDEYTLLKSAFLQRRRAELYYGNPPPTAEELEEYRLEEQGNEADQPPVQPASSNPVAAAASGASGAAAPNAGSN